ncbi:GspC family type II secretion system variant ExeC [Aeromonas encheleia]|nr:GspC family type II secretion system variant ExeC [Aeromonas sp. sif2433]MBV7437909.1 GspC family type II secretion system variant ExeC [Aeromonas sp. sif2416]UNP88960.1 GspC family type II secretion system variant ExeC [Aeromonas encheleia]
MPYTIANRYGCQNILRNMTLPFRGDLFSTLLARCNRVPLSRFSQPLFWLLLLLLAHQCAGLTWRLFDLTQSSRNPAWQPSVVAGQGGEASRLDLSNVSRLSLFGKAPQQAQAADVAAAVAADAPKTQLNAQLNGVLASSDSTKSIAIIAHNGLQNSYGIGDYIDGTQAKIRQVFADRVIIARDGRDETLMLDGEEYGKPLPKVARQAGQLSSVRSELMSNPGKITDYLNISPVRVDGRMVGYRLNPGSKPELFTQLGLVANDLAVSINGLDLRDNAQAMQAMQQVAGATEMTVTVERQGQLYDVYVGLSE